MSWYWWVAIGVVAMLGLLAYGLASISADTERRWQKMKEERDGT